jgi:hypothetical protein
MAIRSIFKPSDSLVMSGATVGLVMGVYNGGVGSMAVAQATDTHDVNLMGAKKKSGWTALAIVAGITLLSRDANVAILGGATIIAMELGYIHAIHSNPMTGQLQHPGQSAYEPAQNVVPVALQGQAA